MNRIITKILMPLYSHSLTLNLTNSMSGIKIRYNKKSTQSIFTQLSQDYLIKYKYQQSKKQTISIKDKQKSEQEQLMQIQELKQNWLNNEQNYIDQLEGEIVEQERNNISHQLHHNSSNSIKSDINKQNDYGALKIKCFKKDLSKTEVINNSRQFLYIICNIFPKYQVQRITSQIKQFCNKRDLNMPQHYSAVASNTLSDKTDKKLKKKMQRQIRYIQKITKQRQRKLFINVKKILNQNINDLEVIDSVLTFLASSDPYIMNYQDVQKLVYSHQQGYFDDDSIHHKSGINIVMDKKQKQSQINYNTNTQQRQIDELIEAKKNFIIQTDGILNKPLLGKSLNSEKHNQTNLEQEQQDLVNVFEEFSSGIFNDSHNQTEINKTDKNNKIDKTSKRKQQKNMKLYVKKNLNQKTQVPDRFQINEHSLHEIQRILFKNKKIVEDNIIFKKIKSTKLNPKLQKQRQQFGKNWIYSYEMPYSINHQTCQQFIDFLSKNYGDIIEYYIFPYKNMLQKRQNMMIYIENLKNQKEEQIQKNFKINSDISPKQDKQRQVADKLLQKIQKQKNLKLNKSSMVFKFRNYEQKMQFLLPEMRLYGLNFKSFRNVRFEQPQSKKLLALSMIPWGCSSQDLLKAINKALKPLDIEVSYQACILAKGFIFIEFDNFYQSLNACRLLNNLSFQGLQLKVQINYGSSKIYNKKYKSALELDHYQTLVNKLKDIKCFYNNIYDDDRIV